MDGSVIDGRMARDPISFVLTLQSSTLSAQTEVQATTDPPFSKLVFITKDELFLWNQSFQAFSGDGWLNLYRRSAEPHSVEFTMSYILDNSPLPIWRVSYLRTGRCIPMAGDRTRR